MVIFLLVPMIMAVWFSSALAADIIPPPSPPVEAPNNKDRTPTQPPPSRIDPGIERRPQTIPDPRSAVTPPIVDPKMAVDPETPPGATEKPKPGSAPSPEPPGKPPAH
jgi:hypothetical protein